MRLALIGHRGTGKSSLMRRIASYYREENKPVVCFDLDREIERRSQRDITAIFAERGEEAFREMERNVFRDIDRETQNLQGDVVLSFGAGFDPALIPETWKVLWVSRPTDASGRIFTDRPRLNPGVPALDEFMERYHRRNQAYSQRADEVLILDEGVEGPLPSELAYFMDRVRGMGASLTLFPEMFRSEPSIERFLRSRVRWGVTWFELRDDLLSEEQMDLAVRFLPDDRTLVSFRDPGRMKSTRQLVAGMGLAFDWPLEFGPCPYGEPRYLSLHERLGDQSVRQVLERFPEELSSWTQFKAALPIHDFRDLQEGHQWWQESPDSRVFLPLSQDGRWSWYRLMQGTSYSLNFYREGAGSGPDQPTLLQWLNRNSVENAAQGKSSPGFAAVLGDPVSHSRTPMAHREFFMERGASVFAIRVTEREWEEGALEHLKALGLRWAAVTSPHKERAYQACRVKDELSESFGAVNTLVWNESFGGWQGANTDQEGFAKAIDDIRMPGVLGQVAVWGGGGTLAVIKSVLPEAHFFSVRTQENRDKPGSRADELNPDTVVWAIGRVRGGLDGPPENWRPRLVIDLNYAEDSPGRAYALACGCRYISGLTMFRFQAEAQRRFWR